MKFTASPSILPSNETDRMSAVRKYDILDTPPDGAFDRITAIAARRFEVPIAIISIVDEDRIWFKSHHGLPVQQIDREPGLCASAILKHEPYILENAKTDVRSLTNPLVAGDFGLRFYAGVPLRTQDGYNLGTLCVIDKEPRPVSQGQIDDLRDLATLVMDQLELRLSARRELERANIATAQATLMAREIEHRVANSLQFVSAMLKLQSKEMSAEVTTQLNVAAQRVGAVARIHRHLLEEDNVASIPALSYISRLCEDLASAHNSQIAVAGNDAPLTTRAIQTVGLLVNEMVTNAAKHGTGTIHVDFTASTEVFLLSVSDEGQGLPLDFDILGQAGLGMRIINALAKQLGGCVSVSSHNGTGRLQIEFPRSSELALLN